MPYPSNPNAFRAHHLNRTSDIWRPETLEKLSGSRWDDDHLHAFRVLLKTRQKKIGILSSIYDEATKKVDDHAGKLLTQYSYEELSKMKPHRIRQLGPAHDFFRSLVQVLLRIPSADLDETESDSRPRRSVKAIERPGFSNPSDDEFAAMTSMPDSPSFAGNLSLPPENEACLPRLASNSASRPQSLQTYLAARDTTEASGAQSSPRGRKRAHEPSSSDSGSVFARSEASSNKSAHDERIKSESVSKQLALHFVQLVVDSAYDDSATVVIDVLAHDQPFVTSFGEMAWRCVNDGCAFLNGDVTGKRNILRPMVLVSFETKALAQDDSVDEGLREKTESERLGQQVSEILGMLGQRLKSLGITIGCEDLEAKIAALPEHIRT
jgi:hypothetical protein